MSVEKTLDDFLKEVYEEYPNASGSAKYLMEAGFRYDCYLMAKELAENTPLDLSMRVASRESSDEESSGMVPIPASQEEEESNDFGMSDELSSSEGHNDDLTLIRKDDLRMDESENGVSTLLHSQPGNPENSDSEAEDLPLSSDGQKLWCVD